jgi:hypothetical protein
MPVSLLAIVSSGPPLARAITIRRMYIDCDINQGRNVGQVNYAAASLILQRIRRLLRRIKVDGLARLTSEMSSAVPQFLLSPLADTNSAGAASSN